MDYVHAEFLFYIPKIQSSLKEYHNIPNNIILNKILAVEENKWNKINILVSNILKIFIIISFVLILNIKLY